MNLRRAIYLASKYHEGQTDKNGQPFIGHPMRVLAYVALKTDEESILCAAAMHDLIEDTAVDSLQLVAEGFGEQTVRLVTAMTKFDGETYFDYIDRVKQAGPNACMLKLADLRDNMDIRRGSFKGSDKLLKRYEKAVAILEAK